MSTTGAGSGADGPDGAPRSASHQALLHVVSGRPDDAELAALAAVVAARRGAPAPGGAGQPASRWADPAHRLGVRVPAPDAWRTSGWAPR